MGLGNKGYTDKETWAEGTKEQQQDGNSWAAKREGEAQQLDIGVSGIIISIHLFRMIYCGISDDFL